MFKIKLIHHASDGPNNNVKLVFEFTTSNQSETEKLVGRGQKIFEFKGSSDAIVPYQAEGWKNSKDLSKENQNKLLKETVGTYNNFRNGLIRKDETVSKVSF